MALWTSYTLYDLKAQQYNPPFYTLNDAMARRMVSELAADMNTTVGRHPSDFKLYKLGSYDDANGIYESLTIMEHVCDIIALVPISQDTPLFPNIHSRTSNGAALED